MSSQPKDFYQEYLRYCLNDLESTPQESPKAMTANLEVARAYRLTEELEKSDRHFEEALKLFWSGEPAFEIDGEALWRYLAFSDLATFEKYFAILFEACEERLEDCASEHLLICALLSNQIIELGQLTTTYLQKAIAIRSAVRGPDNYDLIALFLDYILSCEKLGCIGQVEETVIQLTKTAKGHNLQQILAHCYLSIVNLYLDQNIFDKANNAWQKAVLLEHNGPSLQFAETFGNLVNAYRKHGLTEYIERMIDTWLSNATEKSLRSIDPYFNQLVNAFLESGSVSYAQSLIEKRLKVPRAYIVDYAATDWELRLSESYKKSIHGKFTDGRPQQRISSVTSRRLVTGTFSDSKNFALDKPISTRKFEAIRTVSPGIRCSPVKIRFGLFATQDMFFGHNTTVRYLDPEPDVLEEIITTGKTYEVAICCTGNIHCQGNLEIAGLIHGTVEPIDAIRHRRLVTAPLPQDLKPLLPALAPPKTANFIQSCQRISKSGDYITSLSRFYIAGDPTEDTPIRIFLEDTVDEEPETYIFDGRRCHVIQNENKAKNLQLWYNGTKKLYLMTMSALVYAPNATVEIARGSRFRGAILANRIFAEGNNQISIDLSLNRQTFII